MCAGPRGPGLFLRPILSSPLDLSRALSSFRHRFFIPSRAHGPARRRCRFRSGGADTRCPPYPVCLHCCGPGYAAEETVRGVQVHGSGPRASARSLAGRPWLHPLLPFRLFCPLRLRVETTSRHERSAIDLGGSAMLRGCARAAGDWRRLWFGTRSAPGGSLAEPLGVRARELRN